MANIEASLTPGLARNFDFRFDCDGVEFEYRLRYNRRDEAWYVSIYTSEGESVREGLKAVVNFDLLFRAAETNRPAGRVYFFDVRTPAIDPVFGELGNPVRFIYSEAA